MPERNNLQCFVNFILEGNTLIIVKSEEQKYVCFVGIFTCVTTSGTYHFGKINDLLTLFFSLLDNHIQTESKFSKRFRIQLFSC